MKLTFYIDLIFRFVLRNGSSATPTGSTAGAVGAGPPPRRLRFRGDGLMTDSEDDLVKIHQSLLTCKEIITLVKRYLLL